MELFVDRAQEIETLEKEYRRKGSSLVVLYGRRRVGKTTLITEFIKDKPSLFFLAGEESEAQNRAYFKEKAADFLGSALLREAQVKNWNPIFKAIVDARLPEKPVIVIDEFQYIGRSNPAFPSIFQRIWDEVLKQQPVMVILCGSLISMMESQTLSYGSPLYGRRTAQIRLKQIPFRYYHEFFPGKGERELVELYSVTGGVPQYIELFSQSGDLYQSIQSCVLNPSGYLYDEPHFLLQQEVSEIGTYFSVIRAIAAGNRKLSDIARVMEVKATSLTKYLKVLADLDLLEREIPVTEENPEKCKRGLYRIKDNYIRFWFAFVYPNMSFLETGNSAIVMEKIRASLISSHTAFVCKDICRERMWELNAGGTWPFHFSKIGRCWDSSQEIDIAALDPEGKHLILGECKYWQGPVGANILWELEQKAQSVAWEKGKRKLWYILFSAGGFTEDLKRLATEREDVILADSGGILL